MTRKSSTLTPPPTMVGTSRLKAVIYLRTGAALSSQTAARRSLADQRRSCVAEARRLGAEVVREYVDQGASARTTKRPHLMEMLAFIRNSDLVNFVIVDKIDRLSRNLLDYVTLVSEIKGFGTQLVFVQVELDAIPTAWMVDALPIALSHWRETRTTKEDTQ
jgi:site-specific DNA recombinase